MKLSMFNQTKITLRRLLFLLLSALGYVTCCHCLTSCGDEYEKFQGIEFKTTGVVPVSYTHLTLPTILLV